MNSIVENNLAQNLWKFNREYGKDSNDGKIYPLKTFAEYINRTGLNRYCDVDLRLEFETDIPDTDPIIQTIKTGPNGKVKVVGTNLEERRKGKLSYVRNPTFYNSDPLVLSGQPLGISDGTLPWNYVGDIVQITDGRYIDSNQKAFISKNEGEIARLNRMTYRPNDDLQNIYEATPSKGNSYSVLKLRKLSYLDIIVNGMDKPNEAVLTFENLKLPNMFDGDKVNYSPESNGTYNWCDFPVLVVRTYQILLGCRTSGILATVGGGKLLSYYHLDQAFVKSMSGNWALGGVTSFQASGPFSTGFNTEGSGLDFHSSSGGIEIYDSEDTVFKFDREIVMSLKGQVTGTNNIGPFSVLIGEASIINGLSNFYFHSDTNGNGSYPANSYDFKLSNDTKLYAINDDGSWTVDKRECTYPKLIATVAAGGFGGDIKHYRRGTSINQSV